MAFVRFANNATAGQSATPGPAIVASQAAVYVQTPTRSAVGSGAGGGRVLGTLAAVNTSFPGPKPGGFPLPPTGPGTPLGNPDYPCIAGPQLQPLASALVPIDTGTAYFFRHLPNSEVAGNNAVRFTAEFAPPTVTQQHMVAFDYYQGGLTPDAPDNSQTYSTPIEYVCQPFAVTASSGSPTWNPVTQVAGVGTRIQALQNIGGECLRMDGSAFNSVNLTFDTSTIAADAWGYSSTTDLGGRIVKMSLRYRAWRQSSTDPAGQADPAPSEGLSIFYDDSAYPGGALDLYLASWLVPNYYSVSGAVTTKSLGEVNYGARGYQSDHITEQWHAHPYTVEDLNNMFAGQISFRFQAVQGTGANQRYIYLDHVELVVEIVPERRTACAVRVISNIYNNGTTEILDSSWSRISKGRYPGSSLFVNQLGYTPQPYYDLCIREALPVDTSDLLQVQPALGLASLFEAIGPSLQLRSVIQYQQTQYPQLQTFTGTIIDGQLKSKILTPFEDYNLSVAAMFNDYATTGSFWASYREEIGQAFEQVWGAGGGFLGNYQFQKVWVNAGTTYSYLHVVARPPVIPNSGPDALQFDITDPTITLLYATASVTSAAVTALPDIGEGWRIFEMALSPPLTFTTSQYVDIVAFSQASQLGQWQIAGAWQIGRQNAFGYAFNIGAGSIEHAMYLACTMAQPPAPTVTVQTAASPTLTCDTTTVSWARLTWNGDATVDKYGIESSPDAITWTGRTIIATNGSTALQTFDDYAASWDVTLYYRLVSYRTPDRLVFFGPASTPITVNSGGAVLGFSTDTQAFIYSPVDAAQVNIQWSDLNSVTMVQLHGERFQRALRESQDRGMKFSVQLLIADLGSCTPGAITVAQQSLTRVPFDQIRALQQETFVLVRFPGSPIRRMTLELGGMSVVTASGVYLATVTLTDVSADPLLFSGDEFSPSG